MALNVAQSGGRPNFLPGVIRTDVKRANKVPYLPIFDVTANPPEADEKQFLTGALLCTIGNIVKVFGKFYERAIDIGYGVRYTYITQRSQKPIKIVIVD